jgi:hypothetical protein
MPDLPVENHQTDEHGRPRPSRVFRAQQQARKDIDIVLRDRPPTNEEGRREGATRLPGLRQLGLNERLGRLGWNGAAGSFGPIGFSKTRTAVNSGRFSAELTASMPPNELISRPSAGPIVTL